MAKIRAYADNVVLEWISEPKQTASGLLHLPDNRKPEALRRARVIASGPGYYRDDGHGPFIPNEVKPGDVVLVDRQAGQNYALDLYKPRTHAQEAVYGDGRIVRHDEILAVVEEELPAVAHRYDCPDCDWHAGATEDGIVNFSEAVTRHQESHAQ